MNMSSTVNKLTAALLAVQVFAITAVAQQVPKAVPISSPEDVPRAVPLSPPKPAAVKTPDDDLFEYATLCYTQKEYQIAIKPFTDYTRLYSKAPHAAEAWFKLGECYLKTDQNDEARRAYNELVTRFPKSESAASANYRLGAFAYNAKEFARAATYFEACEKLTTDSLVKLAAIYNRALALKQAGQKKAALAAFKLVAAVKSDNPYRETALSEVATGALEVGNKEEALEAFSGLIATTKDDGIMGDALIKSGLILNELGKSETALKNFKRAIEIKDLPKDTRAVAIFGLIQGLYAKADYKGVIETYVANATTMPGDDLRPKLLLMVGNAHKQKQSYRQAIEVYLMIEKQSPDTPESLEAGYQKLLAFYQMNDKDMPRFTESFEERYAPLYKDHEYLLMSRLIRADWWFGKSDYTKAAEAYAGIQTKRVPEKVRASVLYKKGFAEAESGKWNDAIASLTEFINDYAKDANIPIALAQRGISQKNVRAFDRALADFAAITKDYPDNNAAEMAWYQSGLIKAETRDTAGMIADFEALVAKFPKSAAVGDANFQIGRGYFDMKTKEAYGKALDPLRRAIATDPEKWRDKAFPLLISCQYLREDVDGLAKEVEAYIELKRDAPISPAVLTFLGQKYFERGNFKSSARFLRRLSTPSEPKTTPDLVWYFLGLAQVENGDFEDAIESLDFYLAQAPQSAGHPKAMLGKARAYLGLGKFDEAVKSVDDGLKIMKEGKIHAQLALLQGDIAMAHGDALAHSGDSKRAIMEWKTAAGNFVVVSQIYGDPELTPEALDKAVRALDKLGEKEKSASLRSQLTTKYPNYKGK
ncbi:MAG: tetratricopeptide repeat protein [Verrucomicrobia bacterium]|nr:tetratricopeptide repeat protein [Verrucomicrobiota bacterium]